MTKEKQNRTDLKNLKPKTNGNRNTYITPRSCNVKPSPQWPHLHFSSGDLGSMEAKKSFRLRSGNGELWREFIPVRFFLGELYLWYVLHDILVKVRAKCGLQMSFIFASFQADEAICFRIWWITVLPSKFVAKRYKLGQKNHDRKNSQGNPLSCIRDVLRCQSSYCCGADSAPEQ